MKMQWIKKCRMHYAVILFISFFFPVMAMASSSMGAEVSDSVITARIKADLAKNALIHTREISVKTDDGVVWLKGTVESVTEATTAIEIASSTEGVKNVDVTQLYVFNSSQPMTDTFITAKIKGIFLKNNLTNGLSEVPLSVKVETQNGVVFLSGSVKTTQQREKLIELVKSVEGVKDVKTALKISG